MRRSRRPCLPCRTRKVRCDVLRRDTSCTNCQLDRIECVTPQDRRKAKVQSKTGRCKHEWVMEAPVSPWTHACPPRSSTTLDLLANIYCDSLPPYIKPPGPDTLGSRDILSAKSALKVPAPAVRDLLWKSYVQYVHPSLPLLDLHQFASSIVDNGCTQTRRISLLLYQTVMVCGFFYVDLNHQRLASIPCRKAVLGHMFENVNLLYDFDYEEGPITLIQSLLLMSLWYRPPNVHKDPWHYTGLAVSQAKKMGLHRKSVIEVAKIREQPLLRRLWWCCVMRDYMVAHAMGRPTHISCQGCNIPSLSLLDLNVGPLATGETGLPSDFAMATDVSIQRQLAVICCEQAKLLTICHAILDRQNLDHQDGFSGLTTLHRQQPSGPYNAETDTKTEVEAELAQWLSGLPEGIKVNEEPEDDVVQIHRGLLRLLYSTAIITIHHRQIILGRDPDAPTIHDGAVQSAETSHQRVTQAATRIADICRGLHQRGLTDFLPIPGTTCILTATVIHLLHINFSSSSSPSLEILQSLPILTHTLKKLRGRTSYLDSAWKFLEPSFQKTCETVNEVHGESVQHNPCFENTRPDNHHFSNGPRDPLPVNYLDLPQQELSPILDIDTQSDQSLSPTLAYGSPAQIPSL